MLLAIFSALHKLAQENCSRVALKKDARGFMAVKASIYHRTHYRYDNALTLHPQPFRLKLASHSLDPSVGVAGIRFKSSQSRSASHPNVPVNSPIIFDLYHHRSKCSLGGCANHVAHAGGRNYGSALINGNEMQARSRARFIPKRQSAGTFSVDKEATSSAFPLSLNLRRPIGV